MSVADRIRSLLNRKKPAQAQELAAQLADTRAAYEAANLKAGQERLLHPKHVLAGAADAAKHRELLAQLDGDVSELAVLLQLAEERHAAAVAEEAQAAKAKRYEDARKLRDDAAAKLEAEYDKHAIGLLTLLHLVAQADEAVAIANEDRPEGMPNLDRVEAIVRDGEELPRKVIRDQVLSLWAFEDGERPLSPDQQAQVQAHPGARTGMISTGTGLHAGGRSVVKKRFQLVEYQEALSSSRGDRLADMKLPALRARDPNYWTPGEFYGRLKATDTLRRLNEVVSGARAWRPSERPVRVEYVLTEDPADVEAN